MINQQHWSFLKDVLVLQIKMLDYLNYIPKEKNLNNIFKNLNNRLFYNLLMHKYQYLNRFNI